MDGYCLSAAVGIHKAPPLTDSVAFGVHEAFGWPLVVAGLMVRSAIAFMLPGPDGLWLG
ncbi:hypothetical protein ACFVWG_33530 [Kribbella sp. NPDC058245]|uniref:hypothetical protein n=1 Tax=Kribbella sp. NPDC058245 TaxID=3346399 RepID=UPI0036F0CE85